MFSSQLPEFVRGPLVLFIHGALADARMWQPHLGAMQDHQAFAVTLRHFGEHGQEHQGEFGINQHGQDLLDWLKALPCGVQVHLVGWSYGADVVLAALTQQPDNVASAYLYEPGYPGYLNREAMAAFMQDAEVMFDPVLPHLEQGQIDKAVATLMDGSAQLPGYFHSQPMALRQQQLDNAHTLVQQMQQAPASGLTAAQLANVSVPVTVAMGDRSRALFQQVSQAAAAQLPEADLQVINGGHLWPLEQPEAMASSVSKHVQQVLSVAVENA